MVGNVWGQNDEPVCEDLLLDEYLWIDPHKSKRLYSPAHLAEETFSPATNSPRAMFYAVIATSITGYVSLLLILAAIPPSASEDLNNLAAFALMQILVDSVGIAPGILLNAVLMVLAVVNMYATIVVHARMAFAFSRDGALPGSRWLHVLGDGGRNGWKWWRRRSDENLDHSDPAKTSRAIRSRMVVIGDGSGIIQVPVRATVAVVAIDAIVLVPTLFSYTMFSVVNSFGVVGIYLSYMVPILLRVTRGAHTMPVGLFSLGPFGVPVGIVSVAFLAFSSVALMLPTSYTDPADYVLPDGSFDSSSYTSDFLGNFNWAVVAVAGVFIITNILWVFYVRRWFTGPPIDLQTNAKASRDDYSVVSLVRLSAQLRSATLHDGENVYGVDVAKAEEDAVFDVPL
ncbi:hypothetical protein HDU82_005794 [Entophlyctis luteolus]|nr:hypothetical protein HDU82_005794 [Entophlyctis luteolus]